MTDELKTHPLAEALDAPGNEPVPLAQAAALSGRSYWSLRRAVKAGRLPGGAAWLPGNSRPVLATRQTEVTALPARHGGRFVPTATAAKLTGVPLRTIQRAARAGHVQAVREGRSYLVDLASVRVALDLAFITPRRRKAATNGGPEEKAVSVYCASGTL